jgi:hypothetical protein
LILKRVLALHPDLDPQVIKPWRSYAAVYLWKEFAQTLSKQKGKKPHDSILQSAEVAGRKVQMSRKRRNSGQLLKNPLGVLRPRSGRAEEF